MERSRYYKLVACLCVRHPPVACFALVLLLALGLTLRGAWAANGPLTGFWTANGNVYATVTSGNTLYIGGDFTYVGPPTGNWAALNTGSTGYDASWPKVTGTVYAAIPDGSGGWYLGGDITQVGTTYVSSIAHIKADKSVDGAFAATANSTVWTLALVGNTLYVGGQFSNLDGQWQPFLGAVDATTGAQTGWSPATNGIVYALASDGTTLYVGGTFTLFGNVTRNNIAAINIGSGALTAWNPNASNGTVFSLLVSGTLVYAGGTFTSIGGQPRSRIAALDISTGLATAWNPNGNTAAVRCMALSGTTLYVGGGFTSIGGQARNRIAALDTATGLATAWNPNASAPVRTLTVTGSTVYIGGVFTTVGGQNRNHIAALDVSSGALSSWNPSASGNVYTLTAQGSQLFAGGAFTSTGGATRNHIAALDAVSGQVTAWDPNIAGTCSLFTPTSVHALVIDGATVFAAGCFGSVGSAARSDIAAIDAATGLPTAWDPQITGSFLYNGVYSLAIDSSTVYTGGQFFSVGGLTRYYLAAIDKTSGVATPWNPNANGTVMTLALDGPVLYAGGSFTSIGGTSRGNLAQIDTATGLATAWTANTDGTVDALALDGSTLYLGGGFFSINGTARAYLGAVDKTSAQISAWSPAVDSFIYALTVSGSNIYLGGDFSSINGTTRYYLGSVDKATGAVTAWDPEPDTTISSLAADGYRLYVGGYYDPSYTTTWQGLTAIEFTPPDAAAAPPGGIYGAAQRIALNCTDHSGDGCANLHYTLDGSTPTRASAIYTTALTIAANGTLRFFATDNDGIDGPVQSAGYVIDSVVPTTTVSIPGGIFNAAQTAALTCADDNSGCAATYYTTDGSAPTTASTVYSQPIMIGSNTTLKFFSTDKAGNSEAVTTASYVIDTVPPTTTANPAGGIHNSTQSVTLSCSDANSGCAATYYTTDGSTPGTGSAVYSAPIRISANTTLKFFSVDKAGNREAVNTASYVVDTLSPITTASVPGGTYGAVQSITLSCVDDNSGCAGTYFTLDGSAPTVLSPLYTGLFSLTRNTTLEFFSMDAAGNSEAVQTLLYAINTPPVATDQAVSTDEDTPLNGALLATDLQNDALSYRLVGNGALGTAVITDAASGAFTYTPNPDANGTDHFSFVANDGQVDSSPATVTVTINPVNDPPTLTLADVNGIVTKVGHAVSIGLGVTDPDNGDSYTPSVRFASSSAASATIGTAGVAGTTLTFTPTAAGSDTLTLTVTDGGGLSARVNLPVTVGDAQETDTNNDGVSNQQARKLGLDPNDPGGDTDHDGIPDALEIGDPAHPTDSDGDGVIDALEVGDAATDPNRLDFVVPPGTAARLGLAALRGERMSLTASGALTAHDNGRTGLPLYAERDLAEPDPGYDYPYGVLDFSVAAPSGSATVTIQLPGDAPLAQDMVVRKRGSNGWQTLDNAVIDRAQRTITLHLTDNDALDLDPTPGIIRDPVGVTTPRPPSSTNNSPPPGGGGGVEPLSLLALLLACGARSRAGRAGLTRIIRP